MDRLPSSVMIDIFSRVPIKFLVRSRCVSKVWCEYIDDPYLTILRDERGIDEPTPILYHDHDESDRMVRSLCFHIIESKHTYVLEPKEDPLSEFLRNKPLKKTKDLEIEFLGSCNGLMCLSQNEGGIVTSLVVVNPLRKECYKLPPLVMCGDSSRYRESCGLGFDASTNTLKMVCVLYKEYPRHNLDMVRRRDQWDITRGEVCTMVHVFGTNSWKEIPQVPSYHIEGNSVFANGCLHWLANIYAITNYHECGSPVIWFDVEKEEFGLIDPPKRESDLGRGCYSGRDHLVDLNGEVGYVCIRTKFVWVLKQKEWVPHRRIALVYGSPQVLGCWNKDGDMLIRAGVNGCEFFVYNLKNDVPHKTSLFVPHYECISNIFMHPNKLSSIHGIGKNSFRPVEKTKIAIQLPAVTIFYKESHFRFVIVSFNAFVPDLIFSDWLLYFAAFV